MIVLLLATSFLQRSLAVSIDPETSAKLYLSAILAAVAAIPLSAWLFNKRVKKINPNDPTELNLRIFRVAFLTKLVITSTGFIVNLTLYFFTNNTHLLIIGAIFIVFQMIAIPSRESLFEILGVFEEEASTETKPEKDAE
jgi:hypothetical protein